MRTLEVVCPEPGSVELRETELGPVKAGHVRIETLVTAVSPGTERAWFTAEEGAPVTFPYRPGYCNVGRIVVLGEGVNGFEPGERVLSEAPHASVVDAPARTLVRVPEGVSNDHAALVPLAAISLQGVRKGRIELGTPTAVIGAGLIGLLASMLARLSGAYPLVVSDLSEPRRRLAARLGAHAAVDPDALLRLARELERPPASDPGFDVVIDATGHPAAIHTAVNAAASLGRIVVLGSPRGKVDGLDLYAIHRKGVQVIGAHNRNRPSWGASPGMWSMREDAALILRLVRDGVLDFDALLTDRVGPQEVEGVFERLKARDETMLGCVIVWKGGA